MKKIVTIQITPETRERLKDTGTKRETYDDLINRLLDEHEGIVWRFVQGARNHSMSHTNLRCVMRAVLKDASTL